MERGICSSISPVLTARSAVKQSPHPSRRSARTGASAPRPSFCSSHSRKRASGSSGGVIAGGACRTATPRATAAEHPRQLAACHARLAVNRCIAVSRARTRPRL
eukprot:scaffold314491_cov33-Tisochrysis_lutea.AAC.1